MNNGNGQNIIDKILADADAENKTIVADAEALANGVLQTAKAKADKETASLMAVAEAEAEKAAAKEISAAHMQAKKTVLAKKQEIIAEVVAEAKAKLYSLTPTEYKVIIIGMLEKAAVENGSEIILSQNDKESFCDDLKAIGYKISDDTREIDGGFVVKKGDIEYNYSFESIISVEKEEIEQLAAQILFG